MKSIQKAWWLSRISATHSPVLSCLQREYSWTFLGKGMFGLGTQRSAVPSDFFLDLAYPDSLRLAEWCQSLVSREILPYITSRFSFFLCTKWKKISTLFIEISKAVCEEPFWRAQILLLLYKIHLRFFEETVNKFMGLYEDELNTVIPNNYIMYIF